MRISAENAALLNWDAIAEQADGEARELAKSAVAQAKEEFASLKPGEAKTIPINVGSIRISRPGTPGKRTKAE